MASFRSGFKIIGELTLRQTLGRVRSLSEDRKPRSWLPEDQWAVRPPCTTCPDPCAPKKPPKPSKSWLSICKDPETPLPCDIRHNNCPPPPQPEPKPWYSFMTKKKPEKPKPPLNACRVETQREAENPTEEYCEDMRDTCWPECCEQNEPPDIVCPERPPAPVICLPCPPPKDLDLMLWCGRPGIGVARIASQCQSDRMPYEEFRPTKCWKPPPFSLSGKNEGIRHQPICCNTNRAPLSEYKQIDIPKPLYTRYKSVELEDENFLLCMTDAKCPDEIQTSSLAIQPPPLQKAQPPPQKPKPDPCPEKPFLVAASRKPVKLKSAPKFKFRPKPTKLVERRHTRNPCAQYNSGNVTKINPAPESKAQRSDSAPPSEREPPKVITGTLTKEPQTYKPSSPSKKPPHWMFMLSKPGSKDTPLVPRSESYPEEPDWCGETDGLKFYDGQDDGIHPKPPPDPCKRAANQQDAKPPQLPPCPPPPAEEPPVCRDKFVLMPENFNIRNMRPKEELTEKNLQEASFQEFIDAKTANVRTCSKLYPQMKENILYDLARSSPLPPFDPTKAEPPPRRPPEPECPQPMRFYYRRYSTFGPVHLRKPNYAKVLNRLNSEDSRDKCKPRKLVPTMRECPPTKKGPTCNELEMPCCPKAKVPPRCDTKKGLPPCKKRLAPRPSYSECAKDSIPCQRITECNAWEKRELEKQRKGPSKGRRFSNWAQENVSDENSILKAVSADPRVFTAPGPSYSEYLDLKDRGQCLNKNTLSSHKPRKVFSGKELMLNFVNPTEDTNSYYKSDSLVGRGKQHGRKLKSSQSKTKKVGSSLGNQAHERKLINALLQDHLTRYNARLMTDNTPATSNSVHEQTPNAFADPVGLWTNGPTKAQRSRSDSCLATSDGANRVPETTYDDTADFGRIVNVTNPLGHLLTAHLYDNLCYSPVDSGVWDQKKILSPFRRVWGRNRNKSLTSFPKLRRERGRTSLCRLESLSPGCELATNSDRSGFGKMARHTVGDCFIQNLKDKKDLPSRLEDYSVPAIENLVRTLHLNVRGALCDTQRSSTSLLSRNGLRSYRVNKPPADCTNAKVRTKVGNDKQALRRTLSRFSFTTRGSSTFSKIRKSEILASSKRMETNALADLVQNSGKKGRVSGPTARKKKDEAESSAQNKTRFRQSATSSLVASVTAKKESDSGKLIQYTGADKAVMPLALPNRTWIYLDKAPEQSVKYDFKKGIPHATIVKGKPRKWFQEDDDFPNDTKTFFYGGKKKKKTDGNLAKEDLKYCTDKYMKRQEVRNVLSKLEIKKSVLKVEGKTARPKHKDQPRKDVMHLLDYYSSPSNFDKVEGRFSWQHALFKNNNNNNNNSKQIPSKDLAVEPTHLPAIKSLIDLKEAGPKVLRTVISEGDVSKKLSNNVELYDPDVDVDQCMQLVDTQRMDNSTTQKASVKHVDLKHTKSGKTLKVKNNQLIGTFTYDKVRAVARPKTNSAKCLRAGLHTRDYGTKTPDKKKPKSTCQKSEEEKSTDKGKGNKCTCPTDNCEKCGKSEKCEKNEKSVSDKKAEDSGCRNDGPKKPKPNCPDG